jgi:uncharacterized protein YrrD
MFRPIKHIFGFTIKAEDGDIGYISDLYFDDERLVIRYLVVDTGSWLSGKSVLISPAGFLGRPDWGTRQFPVVLTRSIVKECPDVDTDKPVSRQQEEKIAQYYQWPMYWVPLGPMAPMPVIPPSLPVPAGEAGAKDKTRDSHLRSIREVLGYRINATDGDIGHVDDFIIDDDKWNIGFLVVDAGSWLSGRKVLIALQWIGRISWDERSVHLALSKEEIKESPHYDPAEFIQNDYIKRLHEHYERVRDRAK